MHAKHHYQLNHLLSHLSSPSGIISSWSIKWHVVVIHWCRSKTEWHILLIIYSYWLLYDTNLQYIALFEFQMSRWPDGLACKINIPNPYTAGLCTGTNYFKIHEVSLVDFIFQASFIISYTNTETCNSKRQFWNTLVFWCHGFLEYLFHHSRSTHFQCTLGKKTKIHLSSLHWNICITLQWGAQYMGSRDI